ncbi:MFS transporter [Stakelama saccharophila]|uniref:MFS transporter n=1 Tax=Stakelama saccharophila TaxID=3075605 RepID=A0ABZ0B8G6_9SPHN|nr:MFS transporter [Stakelama sp. W311]WNO53722.1 MFS transporter [Stakelama sp. W311]
MSKTSGIQGRYVPALIAALAALVPYILTTSGYPLYGKDLTADLGISGQMQSLVAALATAGYAYGALVAGDLVNRFTQRRLFLICEATQTAGWLIAASAPGPWPYALGQILAGSGTGMLLVIALPPTIRRFSAARIPVTAIFINVGLFGGVAAGPLLGGIVAATHGWRWLFGAYAALGVATWSLGWFTLVEEDPFNPELPVDRSALLLAAAATVLPFIGAGLLARVGFSSLLFWVPVTIGLGCLAALLVTEFHKKDPLAPVKRMWTTFPVVGTIAATIGGAAFVTFLQLATNDALQVRHVAPIHVGISYWPMLLGAMVAAALLGLVLKTRFVTFLISGSMLLLLLGGVLLLDRAEVGSLHHFAAVLLLGLGAGGTVGPGLFLAGLSLPSSVLGRIVALIELVRSVGDFILAPVLLEVAHVASGPALTPHGIRFATTATLWCAVVITLPTVMIFLAGKRYLQRPDLHSWQESEEQPALKSPALFARFRA